MSEFKHGTLSKTGSNYLFGNSKQEGLRVKYEPHPQKPQEFATKIYRESDGQFIGGTLSIGQDGIIPQEQAINDHICPGCGNTRCSKSERTCWKCGGPLH